MQFAAICVCILWQSLQAWLCCAINEKEEISVEQAFHFSTNDDSVTEIGWGCVLKGTASTRKKSMSLFHKCTCARNALSSFNDSAFSDR